MAADESDVSEVSELNGIGRSAAFWVVKYPGSGQGVATTQDHALRTCVGPSWQLPTSSRVVRGRNPTPHYTLSFKPLLPTAVDHGAPQRQGRRSSRTAAPHRRATRPPPHPAATKRCRTKTMPHPTRPQLQAVGEPGVTHRVDSTQSYPSPRATSLLAVCSLSEYAAWASSAWPHPAPAETGGATGPLQQERRGLDSRSPPITDHM